MVIKGIYTEPLEKLGVLLAPSEGGTPPSSHLAVIGSDLPAQSRDKAQAEELGGSQQQPNMLNCLV